MLPWGTTLSPCLRKSPLLKEPGCPAFAPGFIQCHLSGAQPGATPGHATQEGRCRPWVRVGSLAASGNRLAQCDLKSAGEEYHSALTRQGHHTGMSLVNMLRESSQSQKDKDGMIPLGQGTPESPIHTASRLEITRGVGGGYWLTNEWAQTRLGSCNPTVDNADGHPTHPGTVISANELDT